jgi:NAD(P)-dependent dehydrogenase (short-subunit alcohol dehydrogenase family)
VQLDVRNGPALTAWVEDAADRLGGLDAVVANVSALAVPDTEENWYASFEVDLMHTVRLATAALPHLEASDNGSIVAISSVSGREADFAAGPYGTMKTAVVGYISGLAFQLAGRGVRANVVSPGNTYFENGFWHGAENTLPDLYDMALGLNPTGRMGRPDEMAKAVVFLSSPVSSFTTGTHVVVDGALTRGIQL